MGRSKHHKRLPKGNASRKQRMLRGVLRTLAILIAIPVVLVALLTAIPFAGSIGLRQEALPANASITLRRAHLGERWMLGAGRILNGLKAVPEDLPEAASYRSQAFCPGGESAGEHWRLGYAQAVITPEDWETKTYYEGGNVSIPARKLTAQLDELKVRVIALAADEKNINIFAAVDSIGVTNRQVQQIRGLVADLGLQSVNIAATHTHSGVDSIGFYSKGGQADSAYLSFVNDKTAEAIRAAVAAMEPGTLYMSQIGSNSMEWFYEELSANVGFDEETDEWNDEWSQKWSAAKADLLADTTIEAYGLGEYVYNRREPDTAYSTQMNKLRFAPDNPESRETLLVNFAAHPYVAGLKLNNWPAESISGDFPYYMEELINEAGANFIFLNGAINGIYPQRWGVADISYNDDIDAYYEDYRKPADWHAKRLGRDYAGIALAMTLPPEAIAANPLTNPDNDHGWQYREIIAMMQRSGTVSETQLPPQMNIRLQELQLDIENPFVSWAAKRSSLNTVLLRESGSNTLRVATEIGYLELGGHLGIALMPGEITPDLAWGGGATLAQNALRMREFGSPTLSESAGQEVLVFGLCNDEIGYVVLDNDYSQFYLPLYGLVNTLTDSENYQHYQELLSPGPRTASAIAEAFRELTR